MKIYNIIRAIVSFFAVLSLGSAFADGHPAPYVGVSFGSGDADLGFELRDGLTYDGKDTAYKLYAGYRFNENFAVEGGYAELGENSIVGTGIFTAAIVPANVTTSINWDTNAFFASANASYPLGNFSPFVKFGFIRGKAKATATRLDSNAIFGRSDGSSTELLWGVGASYRFTESIEVRAEWERIEFDENIIEGVRAEPEYDFISVGLVYSF